MSGIRMVSITVGLYLTLIGSVFLYNLPTWCAHPERDGYSMIAGLCK